MHIREADPFEADLLSRLAFESKAHWGYSAEFMNACIDELCVSAQDILSQCLTYRVCEAGDKLSTEDSDDVIGFYGIKHRSSDEAELEALFVKPAYIGKGIGKALFEHATAYSKEQGYKQLTINSDPNAEEFYLAAGAVRIGQEKSGSIAGRLLPIVQYNLEEC